MAWPWVAAVCLLLLASLMSRAENPHCIVTQSLKGTLYNIINDQKYNCSEYMWTNITDHNLVIGGQKEMREDVKSANNTFLLLSGCEEVITRVIDCLDMLNKFEVRCTTNCTGIPGGFVPLHRGTSRLVLVIPPVLLVVLLLVGFCCGSRHSNFRCCRSEPEKNLLDKNEF